MLLPEGLEFYTLSEVSSVVADVLARTALRLLLSVCAAAFPLEEDRAVKLRVNTKKLALTNS